MILTLTLSCLATPIPAPLPAPAGGDPWFLAGETSLELSSPLPSDDFGTAVAVSGSRAAIGAPRRETGGTNSGAVFVYERSAGGWTQTDILQPIDAENGQLFGIAVAIDGDTIVVGAAGDHRVEDAGGAAYVFEYSGSWTEVAKLQASPPREFGFFGGAVAVDGETIVVGESALSGHGAAHIFRRSGGSWPLEQRISPIFELDAQFGTAVDVEGDLLIVGAPFKDDFSFGMTDAGMAQVFERTGTTWNTVTSLVEDDPYSEDQFGTSVAIEAGRAFVGCPWDINSVSSSGSVFVFEEQAGSWVQVEELVPSDAAPDDYFGWSLAHWDDLLMVGAPRYPAASRPGAAYLWQDGPSGFTQKLRFDGGGGGVRDDYGRSVSVDRNQLVAGAPERSTSGGGNARALLASPSSATYCYGDGSGTACACGSGAAGHGCPNSAFADGASLHSIGLFRVSSDTLQLRAQNLSERVLFFYGHDRAAGGAGLPFGDGLRCVIGGTRRMSGDVPDAQGALDWPAFGSLGIGARSSAVAGQTLRYQGWYRDPASACTGARFNLTNAVEVLWRP